MTVWLAVALGGAFGALARFAVARAFLERGLTGFPWATLTVNLLGAAVLGASSILLAHRGASPPLRLGWMAGLLGAFTTYSTFNLELIQLLLEGRRAAAALYGLATLVGALAAGWLGIVAARTLTGTGP
jgi:CrcB protein